jgi:hypothetical protein
VVKAKQNAHKRQFYPNNTPLSLSFRPISRLGRLLFHLDRLPLHAKCSDGRQTSYDQGRLECLGDGVVVSRERLSKMLRSDQCLQVRNTCLDDQCGIDARNLGQSVGEVVREDVLADRYKESSAEELEEQDASGAGGNVFERKHGLRSHDGLLEAEADTQAEDDLVADPLGGWGAGGKGCEHATADGHQDCGEEDKWHVVSEGDGEDPGCDGGKDLGHNQRNIIDARLHCADTVDSLEPDWKIIDHNEESTAEAEGKERAK